MKRPLGTVVLLFIAGIVVGHLFTVSPALGFALSFCLWPACWFRERERPVFLALLIPVAGLLNVSLHRAIISPDDLRLLAGNAPQLVTIRGTVTESDFIPPDLDPPQDRATIRARVVIHEIRFQGDDWQPVVGTVAARTRLFPGENLSRGQTIELFGVLSEPPAAFARGMFDYRRHLANQGIYHTIESMEPGDLTVISPSDSVIDSTGFRLWAMRAIGEGHAAGDPAVELLWAMCLGWRSGLSDELSEPFLHSGTMHLFAISGLHIALIAMILVGLLKLARVPREWSGLVVIPLLWLYTDATGWQPSAVRATIMMSVILGGWSLRRPADLLNSLSAAALIILVWDPLQLFQAGFQLSFAVVGTIALALPWTEQVRNTIQFGDPMLPLELRPKWQQWLYAPLRFLTAATLISAVAFLGSLPLIMHYFHLVTPVSLIANVVVVQLGTLALASTLGCLICAPVIPFCSELFNQSAWFFMNLMMITGEWFSRLPHAWAAVKSPPWYSIAAYFAALIVAGTAGMWKSRRVHATAALLLVMMAFLGWRAEYRSTRLTVLPLRGGHAVFLEQPGGDNWLIDCGDERSFQFVTRPFLRAQGVGTIDNLILSHADIRHTGAASNLIAEFNVRSVFLPANFRQTARFKPLIEGRENEHPLVTFLEEGDRAGPWLALHPRAGDRFSRADSGALVLTTTIQSERLLLCPDLDAEGQDLMLLRHPRLTADTLILSPNNQDQPARTRWLESLKPKRLIMVDTLQPATDRLPEARKKQLKQDWPGSVFTSESGAVELTFEGAP